MVKIFFVWARSIGLFTKTAAEWFRADADTEVLKLIRDRNLARSEKRWGDADDIRKSLLGKGIVLEDTPAGTTWRRA